MNREKITQRLKILRGNRPAKDVADEIGISLTCLYSYESGARVPNDETKELIASYYGVTVQEIFFDN